MPCPRGSRWSDEQPESGAPRHGADIFPGRGHHRQYAPLFPVGHLHRQGGGRVALLAEGVDRNTYEGQTFDELNFDFEGLTGDDALAIEDELQAIGKPTISPTFSGQFLVRMAARACTNTIIDASGRPRRIGDDALRALPIFEFNRVRGKARSFLLASEL